MFQRKQTIFLLLAGILPAGLFKADLAIWPTSEKAMVYGDNILDISDNTALLISTIAAIVLCLVAMLLFKNRKLQLNIVYLAILGLIALLGLSVFFISNAPGFQPAIGLALPVISILLVVLASRGIKSDEKLVRSSDRLR